ncbi:MAG: hypothetical protein J7623_01795 [Chitinophaga sp.]|uniref:hypothetical protein n=1 Tax=Chitinophaga sp. TaxID=1869181 RepID=UPI001B288F84|nr:hypothetical protein [Chitinophaga sp.]MBO9727349.1 hypothetical protein [Chitinophaga sp.]
MKRLFVMLCMQVVLTLTCFAQAPKGDLQLKNINDTFLLPTRNLILNSDFNPQEALLQLFPGKHYRLVDGKNVNEMINWKCKTCMPKRYEDVNGPGENDGFQDFPKAEGIATRLLNVMDFKDSSGLQYKVMSFNHSVFHKEGFQGTRLVGGLLGLAKFVRTDQGWHLRMFTPVIKAYGDYSACPAPKPLQIGADQYAFMLEHSSGMGDGPFHETYYLIAGINGAYQQVMAVHDIQQLVDEDKTGIASNWKSTYSVPASDKKYFRDIVVTTTGTAIATDAGGLPKGVDALLQGKKKIHFVQERRFVYKGPAKGYEQLPAQVRLAK